MTSSVAPPIFLRGPRHYVAPPTDVRVSLPQLPSAVARPTSSLALVILSAAAGAATLVASLIIGGQALYLAILIVPTLGYSAYGLTMYVKERRRYPAELRQRREKLQAALVEPTRRLEQLAEQQRSASQRVHPTWQECLARVQRRDPRLWERTPGDADFLELRVGMGTQRAVYSVDAQGSPGDESDELTSALQDLARRCGEVDNAPLTLNLPELGVVGMAGSMSVVQARTRALLAQLATHHAPTDVGIALVFSASYSDAWTWTRWLPHVWDEARSRRRLASDPDGVRRVLGEMDELIKRRGQQRRDWRSDERTRPSKAYVVVLADASLWEDTPPGWLAPMLRRLRTEGPGVGIYPVFVGQRAAALPGECAATLDATGANPVLRIHRRPAGDDVLSIALDQMDVLEAEVFARACAPLRLSEATHATSGEIPRRVSLLDLFDGVAPDHIAAAERWEHDSAPFTSLAVPIGRGAGGEPLLFDLHDVTETNPGAGGPNALVAGTVGSGKSELLLSLIASLGVHFHPHEVVFALLDFKGGATADAVRDLPHVVSSLTDLELDQVPRALVSLKAELARREQLFRDASEVLGTTVNHIDTYLRARREGRISEPLPYLVLIVDEFVVLKQALPEQMDKFVNIAVKGRALGIRMLLAAQKPAGAIGDQIRANTRSRICLRVAQAEDSQEMIGRPDAANLTGVGRAFVRIGEDELFETCQVAWSGAPLQAQARSIAESDIAEVALDGVRLTRGGPKQTHKPEHVTQLQALIQAVQTQADARGIERLQGPWLPLLPESLELGLIRKSETGGWDGAGWRPAPRRLAPIVGLVDDPHRQRQEPLAIPLGTEGNVAIFGGPGSGKTTLLQTLISSLALDHPPSEVECYVWDGTGALRAALEPLPHVGGVVLGSESERVERWWWMLRRRLAERSGEQDRGSKPAVVVAIDNYAAFTAAHEHIADELPGFAQQCAGAGMYLVVTSPVALPFRLASSFPQKVALELADPAEYPDVVGDTRVDADTSARLIPKRGVRGRGLVAHPPREFQIAMPPQLDAAGMARTAGDLAAEPVATAPEQLQLSAILVADNLDTDTASTRVPLGVLLESLAPLHVDLDDGPHFVVTGPHRSGKSTALQSWLLGLSTRFSPDHMRLILIDFGSSPGLAAVRGLPHALYVDSEEHVAQVVDELGDELQQRRQVRDAAHHPRLVVAIDDADQFEAAASSASSALENIVRRRRGLGCHVLLAGLTSDLAASYGGVIGAVRASQTGLLVGSGDDGGCLNLRLPRAETDRSLPPGRGYYVRRGFPSQALQVASAGIDEPSAAEWVAMIDRRWRR